MNLPYIAGWDVIDIVVNITEGINEDGVENVIFTYAGKCNFSEKAKIRRLPDGKTIQLTGKAFIGCDIAPEAKLIEGNAMINNKAYKIFTSSRPRNPGGTVHHTELELI